MSPTSKQFGCGSANFISFLEQTGVVLHNGALFNDQNSYCCGWKCFETKLVQHQVASRIHIYEYIFVWYTPLLLVQLTFCLVGSGVTVFNEDLVWWQWVTMHVLLLSKATSQRSKSYNDKVKIWRSLGRQCSQPMNTQAQKLMSQEKQYI
jgi:hypothetical protein